MADNVYIFGYGDIGNNIINTDEFNVLGFLDNNTKLWNKKNDAGLTVYNPEKVLEGNFDSIIVASTGGFKEIPEQLMKMGISRDKIILDYALIPTKGRITFLEKLGEIFAVKNMEGAVAEGGVYRGNFSCEINRIFPNKKIYLFDTFTGFDKRDMELEYKNNFSECREQNHFMETSEELVVKKLPYPERAIIKKGYFPETIFGLEEIFCFVNLDFDLYHPIIAGLEYFYPRMVKGGIILVHDFFSKTYKGVKQAVFEFDKKVGIELFPIGDGISVGIYC
ncbi:MAG: TylF/MycF family methyltransferase [Treponema sp.]|jgi:hypothetical protein|nr:TylF/MycF family methyltransferase [Treponema sp.]